MRLSERCASAPARDAVSPETLAATEPVPAAPGANAW
jgi:hypothetical protein